MEQQPSPPDPDEPSNVEVTEPLVPLRKRQRQNLQDVSNTKPLTPIRASGRIRIKMTAAAAEQKQPEPVRAKSPKVIIPNTSSNKQKRRPKKLKTDLVSELAIDVKRPSSVLVDTSIRALLTNIAFSQLSPENQKILIESLPLVDRPTAPSKENQRVDLNPSSINNEFFNRACIEWRDRLSNGEFTNEHQTKLRAEHEREKSKIDPWKARNFEGIWGIKMNGHHAVNVGAMMEKSALEMKDMVEQGDFEIPEGFISEVWKGDEVCDEEDEKIDRIDVDDEDWKPSTNLTSQSSSETTPDYVLAETVTSTQSEYLDSPEELIASPQDSPEQTTIAEATSSADTSTSIAANDFHEEVDPPVDFMTDDVYANEIASNVELSNEGTPTMWSHQKEHDYLKNIEPEPSGMEEIETKSECDANEAINDDIKEIHENIHEEEDTYMDDNDSLEMGNISRIIRNVSNNPRLNESFDVELPQEIFSSPEKVATSIHAPCSNLLMNNFVHHQQVIESGPSRYSNAVVMKEEEIEPTTFSQETNLMVAKSDHNESVSYHDEVRVNMPKNVKVLAFPSGGKFNEKIIIEEQHLQPSQQINQEATNFRSNGVTNVQPIQNSYFVGGNNYAYISKFGNKLDGTETRIIQKQDSSNSQGQIKQRIIYEIASEPKVSYEQPHQVTFSAQPQQEVFHQMVNGTATIYETAAPPKKTIIQRKKTIDPYTVQVVANNNTIILTPIGSTTQTVQQPQKSIVHIHRTGPILQNASPVQFLAAPQAFLKKQTVIHPQMAPKSQPKYTTVIRAPSVPQIVPPTQQVVTTVSSKIQRPIQKQKVIMSTSSLQQYRSYNQKSSVGHNSRKQLHPQHIIRPAPATTVIHQMIQEQKNQIPVILPAASNSDHVIMSNNMSNQIPTGQSTVVALGSQQGINNIYVRPRTQSIFQPSHQHLNTMITNNNLSSINNQQQQQSALPPRMRHQQNNQRPPPGTVNLERSYQICQAVIQNSSNRLQLNSQLNKPPHLNSQKF